MQKGDIVKLSTGFETIEIIFQGMKADHTAQIDIMAPIAIKIDKKKQPRKKLVFIQE